MLWYIAAVHNRPSWQHLEQYDDNGIDGDQKSDAVLPETVYGTEEQGKGIEQLNKDQPEKKCKGQDFEKIEILEHRPLDRGRFLMGPQRRPGGFKENHEQTRRQQTGDTVDPEEQTVIDHGEVAAHHGTYGDPQVDGQTVQGKSPGPQLRRYRWPKTLR